MTTPPDPHPRPRSRFRFGDVLRTGTGGLAARRGRTALTTLGIAIGIAAMVSVLGISASSRADLVAQLDALGTDLLRVEPGQDGFGQASTLPTESTVMIRRIDAVASAAAVTEMFNMDVQRNANADDPHGLTVAATEPELLTTLSGQMQTGRFLDDGTATLPTVVLGSVAAERLGIRDLRDTPTLAIGTRSFAVIGILESMPLHPDLDRTALVGIPAAEALLSDDAAVPTQVYVRALGPEQVDAVTQLLPPTANPSAPNEVAIARPSDALQARATVDQGLQTLLLGLGAVSLLVGGVGIANVMVVSVMERRSEIGLRRALGAKRSHIAGQFVVESASLAMLGGIVGIALGATFTTLYALREGWRIDVPLLALAGGVAAALVMGVLAGLYPAGRAARMDPADAVRPA